MKFEVDCIKMNREEDEEHGKNVESTFWDITCLTSQNNQFLYTGYFSHILHLDIIKWNQLQIESENEQKSLYMVFNGDRP